MDISPLFITEYEDNVSLCLTATFGVFPELQTMGFQGSGYDWAVIAELLIEDFFPESGNEIEFDCEFGMFVAIFRNKKLCEQFADRMKEIYDNKEILQQFVEKAEFSNDNEGMEFSFFGFNSITVHIKMNSEEDIEEINRCLSEIIDDEENPFIKEGIEPEGGVTMDLLNLAGSVDMMDLMNQIMSGKSLEDVIEDAETEKRENLIQQGFYSVKSSKIQMINFKLKMEKLSRLLNLPIMVAIVFGGDTAELVVFEHGEEKLKQLCSVEEKENMDYKEFVSMLHLNCNSEDIEKVWQQAKPRAAKQTIQKMEQILNMKLIME